MTVLSLQRLAEHEGEDTLSIFLPGGDPGNDRKRATQLKKARDAVSGHFSDHEDLDNILDGFDRAIHTAKADTAGAGPIAIYVCPHNQSTFRLEPSDSLTAMRLVRGRQFDLRPTAPAGPDADLCVLIASQSNVSLWHCKDGVLTCLSDDMEDSRLSDVGAEIDWQTDNSSLKESISGGTYDQAVDKELQKYAKAIALDVDKLLSGRRLPLVIVADDDLLGRLRQELSYPHVCEDGIREHPESLKLPEIIDRATALVRKHATKDTDLESIVARLKDDGNGATSDPDHASEKAREGAIEVLYFDPESVGRDSTDNLDLGSGDPANDAIRHTLLTGGDVRRFPASAPEDLKPIAALFRY